MSRQRGGRGGIGISLYSGGLEGRPYRGGRGGNRFNRNDHTDYEEYHRSDDDDVFYDNQNPTFESTKLENNWEDHVDDFEESDLNLNPNLIHMIYSIGFHNPNKIQSLCLKPIFLHRNIIVQSASNSGKTTSLCIGVLQNINAEEKSTQALILVPNRLIASQMRELIVNLGNKMNEFQISVFINDDKIEQQKEKAKNLPHIVVATPGRACKLIQSNFLKLDQLKMVCFDEVDEFVTRGSINKVGQILTNIRPGVQVLVFSTIIPTQFFSLVEPLMTDPVKIIVEEEESYLDQINQYFVNVGNEQNKFPTLIDLYGQLAIQKCIVFANQKKDVDYLENSLRIGNFEVCYFHNRLEQSKLEETINKFKNGAARILVSTDIPKGVSFSKITLIFSYNLPPTIDSFLERVKRSAAFGVKNIIHICNEEEMKKLKKYMSQIHQKIEELPVNFNEIMKQ